MAQTKKYSIEVTSSFQEFWRYNIALMCGCFDADDKRIGFASVENTVADVGSDLTTPPTDYPEQRYIRLEAPDAHHLLLYIYIIPHTLPKGSDVAEQHPFPLQIRIVRGGHTINEFAYAINQWSGASIELRIGPENSGGQTAASTDILTNH